MRGRLEPAPAGDDHLRLLELGSRGRLLVVLDATSRTERVRDVHVDGDDVRRAADGLRDEGLRADEDELRSGAVELHVDEQRAAGDLRPRTVDGGHVDRVAHERRAGLRLETAGDITRDVRGREQDQVGRVRVDQRVERVGRGLSQALLVDGVVAREDRLRPVPGERRRRCGRARAERHGLDLIAQLARLGQELERGGRRSLGRHLGEDPDLRHVRSPWPLPGGRRRGRRPRRPARPRPAPSAARLRSRPPVGWARRRRPTARGRRARAGRAASTSRP